MIKQRLSIGPGSGPVQSTKKITKSNLHKPTESAKYRIRVVNEKQPDPYQWDQSTNPKQKLGVTSPKVKAPKLKIEVKSKLDKPTLSSQYKEKDKFEPPPPSPPAKQQPSPISQHSRLVNKTTKSLIAASKELHQRICSKPPPPPKPFSPAGTAIRTSVSQLNLEFPVGRIYMFSILRSQIL